MSSLIIPSLSEGNDYSEILPDVNLAVQQFKESVCTYDDAVAVSTICCPYWMFQESTGTNGFERSGVYHEDEHLACTFEVQANNRFVAEFKNAFLKANDRQKIALVEHGYRIWMDWK